MYVYAKGPAQAGYSWIQGWGRGRGAGLKHV